MRTCYPLRRLVGYAFFVVLLVLVLPTALHAQNTDAPYDHPLFTGPVQSPRTASFDQRHLALDVELDPQNGSLEGTATLSITPYEATLDSLTLFAHDLGIEEVAFRASDSTWTALDYRLGMADSLVIPIDSLYIGLPYTVRIRYSATPKRGAQQASGEGRAAYFWTDAQPNLQRHWVPLNDLPSDRLTTTLRLTVPEGYSVFASGRRDTTLTTRGQVTSVFTQDLPLSPDQIGWVTGAFTTWTDTAELATGLSLPLTLAAPPSTDPDHISTFANTSGIVRYFSDQLQYAYPWSAYTQVVVPGLEQPWQSFSGVSLFPTTLLADERGRLDLPPENTLAEALAAQWFGALVNVDFPTEQWLMKGAIGYTALRYLATIGSETDYVAHLDAARAAYLKESATYRRPLAWDQWELPLDLDDAHEAARSIWVYHLLHESFGERAVWNGLGRLLAIHDYTVIDASHLQRQLEGTAGTSLATFFDQWVYSAGHPELAITWDYDAANETLVVNITQEQDGYLVPATFSLPAVLDVYTLAGPTTEPLTLTETIETRTVPLAMSPRYVHVGGAAALLGTTTVDQNASAWVAQLRFAENTLARLQAARALTTFTNDPALRVGLRNALQQEMDPLVRAAILATVDALPASPAARDILLSYTSDEDQRVRLAAIQALGDFVDDTTVHTTLLATANNDTSYRVQAAAVEALVHSAAPQAADVVRSALITPSYQTVIQRTALALVSLANLADDEIERIALTYSAADQPTLVRLAALPLLVALVPELRSAARQYRTLLADASAAVRAQATHMLPEAAKDAAMVRVLEDRLTEEPEPHILRLLRQQLTNTTETP